MNIGHTIKRLRREKRYSQIELAEQCNITQTSLSQIESGKTFPQTKTLNVICKVLETPEGFLYLMSIKENDVPKKNKKKYRLLFPIALQTINQILNSDTL